ncbi:MAG: FlgO family outer membrane protein [Leptospirillum sp.]
MENKPCSFLSPLVPGRGRLFSFLIVLFLFMTSCQTSPAEHFSPQIVTGGGARETPVTVSRDLTSKIDSVLDATLEKGKPQESVIVPKFMDNRGVSRVLGRYLASRISEGLSTDPALNVVDSGKLRQKMHLEAISQGGQGSSSMVMIARELNADRIVLGRLTDLGQQIEISVRVISVSDGKVLGQVSKLVKKNGSFLNLWDVGP